MKSLLHIFFFLVILAQPAIGKANTQLFDFFKQSVYYQNLHSQKTDLQRTSQNLYYQTPISIQTEYTKTKAIIPDANNLGQNIESSDSVETSIIYGLRNSLQLSLSGQYAGNQYLKPNALSSNTTDNYFINLRGEYSITQGGKRALAEINQQTQIAQANINLLNFEIQINQQLLEFTNTYLQYLANQCKLKENQQLSKSVKKTLDKGKLLYDTQQISKRDYLNYLDLHNNFQSRIQNIIQTVTQLKNQLLFYMDIEQIKSMNKSNSKFCSHYSKYSNTLKTYIDEFKIENTKKETLFDNTYSNQAESQKILKNNLDLKLQKISRIPNVKPFLQAQTSRPDFLDQHNHTIMGGVGVDWGAPSKKTRADRALLEYRASYFPSNIIVAKASFFRDFNQTMITYQTQKSVYNTLMQSLSSTNQLLQYFDAQRGVQRVDSLNYSNTLIRKSDLLNSLHDLVATVENQKLTFLVLKNNLILEHTQ